MMLLEAINRLRTGGQKKRTNNDLQNTTQKKIEQHEPTKQTSERTCSETVLSSCSTNGTSRVAFATNQISRE